MHGESGDTARSRFSLILPAHNEEELLASTVSNLMTGIAKRDVSYEIVIVENGSTDRTGAIALELAAHHDVITTLTLPVGDYGAALATGFGVSGGDIVVSFDVDYYDLAFLDAAATLIDTEGADIVVASKRTAGADDRRSWLRRLLTFGFTTLLRWMVDLPVSDAHGMKAMRRATVAPLVAQCQLRGSLYDVELVCRAGRAGLTIRELPATVIELRPVRSSVGRRAIEGLVSMIRLRRILRAEDRTRP